MFLSKKIICSVIFAICICLPVNFAFAKKKVRTGVTAEGAILVDANNNKILYSKNIHKRLEPASTAKIMTALLVLEKLDMDSYAATSENACAQEPSKIHLQEGAKYKVEDLLHAILMASSNDASTCLAEAVSGNEVDFVQLMNKRARQLGCKDTRFANSSGLPAKTKQYASVYDLSLIMRKLVKYPAAVEIMKKKNYTFKDSQGRIIELKNHNKLLWKYPDKAIGKTGFTKRAKHCFVGNDLVKNKEVVFAILKSKSLWADLKFLLQKAGCIR